MFGDNLKRPVVKGDGRSLSIKSIFKTLQAEGPYCGVPAIFIRLGGCNLACSFCDTEFEDYLEKSLDEIIGQVEHLSKNSNKVQSIFLVVITGGEPFRQPIYTLCEKLLQLNYKVQIETNGTIYRKLPKEVKIICSPKISNGKYHPIRSDLLLSINAFKFIISKNHQDYQNIAEVGQSQYGAPVYLQPMDEQNEEINQKNLQYTVRLAQEIGCILSLQTHKIIGIR